MAKLKKEDEAFITDNLPPPYNTPEKYREYIEGQTENHQSLCTQVIQEVETVLDPLIKQSAHRFFCRIDSSNQRKDPARIIQKIRLSQDPCAYLANFATEMKDLARFRVVVNFLHDIDLVAKAVKTSPEITRHCEIKEKSSIDQPLKKRESGERSVKLKLQWKNPPQIWVEIQIMTQLQEAWDKKEHPLVYEKKRARAEKAGQNIPLWLDGIMLSMSELFYVADQYFDKIRGEEEDCHEGTEQA